MDTTQTAKMVAWLDEERRKDKATISKLEERATSQSAVIEDQARRLQELEKDITGLRTSLVSSNLFDDTVDRLRNEMTASLEQALDRRSTIDQEVKKLREMERESFTKTVEELRVEMTTRIDRAMQPRRTEEERLGRVAAELQTYADNLGKSLEEFERTLNFLEEQRRQDSRRISDINGEVAEIAKRTDTQQSKVELLEELSRRNERNNVEMVNSLEDFKQQRLAWNEQQALAEQQRERNMAEMTRRMDSFAEEMTDYSKRFEKWAEAYRGMKQHLDDFDRLVDRVERRLNELGEVQRLSEERFRKEWEEFLGDDQKRWRQFTLTNDEAWRGNEKAVSDLQVAVTQLKENVNQQLEFTRTMMRATREMLIAVTDQFQLFQGKTEEIQNTMLELK
jgi:chromosome segregation ATPase